MPKQDWFLAGFFIYLLLMMLLSGWVSHRYNKGLNAAERGEGFLLGGRSLPFWLTLGTTVATMVGTGSSMGAVGYAYQHGFAGVLYGLGGAVGILLLAWWFAPLRPRGWMRVG